MKLIDEILKFLDYVCDMKATPEMNILLIRASALREQILKKLRLTEKKKKENKKWVQDA